MTMHSCCSNVPPTIPHVDCAGNSFYHKPRPVSEYYEALLAARERSNSLEDYVPPRLRAELERAVLADVLDACSPELLAAGPVLICGPGEGPRYRAELAMLELGHAFTVHEAPSAATIIDQLAERVKPAPLLDWAEARQHYERQHAPRFRDTKPVTTKKARKAARRRQHAARKRAR